MQHHARLQHHQWPPARDHRSTAQGLAWARFAIAMLVAFCLLWPSAIQAQDIAPAAADGAQTILTLKPVADATIIATQLGTTGGNNSELRIAQQPDRIEYALLRFDVSALPAGATIKAATLRLYQTRSDVDASAVFLPLYRILEPWDEAKVTWANQPPFDDNAIGGFDSPAQSAVEVEADITALVAAWVSGAFPNEGLLITTGANDLYFARAFSSREGAKAPQLLIDYTLPPLRICREQIDDCQAAAGAILSIVGTQEKRIADAAGVVDSTGLALGQQLWARLQVESGDDGARFDTAAPVTIDASRFVFRSSSESWEMPLAVTEGRPLWIQDLTLSAQWFVEANPADAAQLRDRIIKASDYLYSFTDGQFALGNVTVRQLYDGWDAANIQLYANNILQPKAIIGGIVGIETPDFALGNAVRYSPGAVSMGSYWNRFGSPPNSLNVFDGTVYNENDVADDWSLALAHEFGHYLLYLFDTYTGVDGISNLALTKLCTGTAMGDVYRTSNQNFIFDPTHWNTKCNGTEAFARLNGRTEWQTIAGWYAWVVPPVAIVDGPVAPPAPVTSVTFVAPRTTPGRAAPSLFNLDYRDGETSSGEARAFLYQGGRLVEQGKPPEASLTLEVTGAQVGDRLCVYDVNDHASTSDNPRHQFGCEEIAANDVVFMTKEETWNPQITLLQVGAQQLQIVVRADVAPNQQVSVRLFPEHQTALTPLVLPRTGDVFSATVKLSQPVPALYAQVFVNEAPAAPTTRREIVADRGTGGGGAFGPAKAYGGALVVSSDGNATFEFAGDLDLAPGQSIAWQSMPGTPPLPPFRVISGQSYRLDAFPPALAGNGIVHIIYDNLFGAQGAGAAESAGAGGPANTALYFWNGTVWRRLPTQLTTPADSTDGEQMASAPSQGVGVYAVLADLPGSSVTYLPMVRVKMK